MSGSRSYNSAKSQTFLPECLFERGLSMDALPSLAEKRDPQLNCVQACILEKKRILKDGHINRNEAVRQSGYVIKEFGEETAIKLIELCIESAKSSDDKCEKANTFTDCIIETLQDLVKKKIKKLP
uniref:Uncharacterized protein n=1 Tax=Trichogramma kaykai TaxID=54128 RepID=A0ABD2WNM8_9HYME